jgi:hypothetical protein
LEGHQALFSFVGAAVMAEAFTSDVVAIAGVSDRERFFSGFFFTCLRPDFSRLFQVECGGTSFYHSIWHPYQYADKSFTPVLHCQANNRA